MVMVMHGVLMVYGPIYFAIPKNRDVFNFNWQHPFRTVGQIGKIPCVTLVIKITIYRIHRRR